MLTVHDLRKRGFKVRVFHHRDTCFGVVLQNGGVTHVTITDPLGATREGFADCSPNDQFNRKLGLRIALGRAAAKLGLPTK
jgi:hypothetical protein